MAIDYLKTLAKNTLKTFGAIGAGGAAGQIGSSLISSNPINKAAPIASVPQKKPIPSFKPIETTGQTPPGPVVNVSPSVNLGQTNIAKSQSPIPQVQASSPEKNLATLINPATNEKKVVTSGSPEAQSFFGQGYVLMGSQAEKDAKSAQSSEKNLASITPTPPPVTTPAPALRTPTVSTPVAPAAQQVPSEIDQLRQAVLAALTPSDQERMTANQLGELISGTNQNIANIAGQGRGITKATVLGQQGALAQQAAAEQQTLESRLGRLQAERNAGLQTAQTLLGFSEQDRARQDALAKEQQALQQQSTQQIQTLALQAAQRGASQEELNAILGSGDFNSALGLASPFLTPQEKKDYVTLSEGQTLYDPSTGQPIFTAPKTGGGISFESLNPLQQLQYQKLEQEITGTTPEKQQQNQAQKLQAQQIVNNVNELLNDPGLSSAVGARVPFGGIIPGTDRANFQAKLDTFKSQLVLPELGQLKGSLSDKDITFLQSAVGALNQNMSEKEFKSSLEKIRDRSQHVSNKLGLPAELQTVYDQIRSSDSTLAPDDILGAVNDYIESTPVFNNALSTAQNGSVQIPQTARLAYVNNNPGNLRFVGQNGAVQGEGGFAKFSSPEAGYQALLNQIGLDASRGLSLGQFINKYAPPTENNTSLYLQQVIQATGANANTPISQIDRNKLGQVIALKESSTRIA